MGNPDTLFRSVEMSLVQLYVATEIGRETVSALGEVGEVQFRDLNREQSAFQRRFTNEIRRLDNVERQMRYLRAQMTKHEMHPNPLYDRLSVAAANTGHEINDIYLYYDGIEQRIIQLTESYDDLRKRWVELTERRWVLQKSESIFDESGGQVGEQIRESFESDDRQHLLAMDRTEAQPEEPITGGGYHFFGVGSVAGVIETAKINSMAETLWKVLRGNLFMRQVEIEEPIKDPKTNEDIKKTVFVIFAHGPGVLARIRKIVELMGGDIHHVDENRELRLADTREVDQALDDINIVLHSTESTLRAELGVLCTRFNHDAVMARKEKAIHEALNLFYFDRAHKCLIAEAWIPTNSISKIQSTIREVTDRAGLPVSSVLNVLKTNKTPPTYNKTNKFTLGFQTIIDAYGTAKYQEVNPGITTIITFPFLFAVMFGDVGHGFIMLLAASVMIYYEKPLGRRKWDELFDMAFFGRYIILLMGAFSIYTGFLYNDIFSRSMSLFPSMWEWPHEFEGNSAKATRIEGRTYPFGIDWGWHGTENNLIFTNSYKMKLSIILGWAHMTYSLILSFFNHRFFKSKVDVWGNFIPSMLFMQSIFGYLVLTMVYKWTVDWVGLGKNPPSILNMLIYMFLSPGNVAEAEQLYPGQAFVQTVLLLIAAVCVPWLLFLKPFWLRYEHKHKPQGYHQLGSNGLHRESAMDEDDAATAERSNGTRQSLDSDMGGILAVDEEEEEEFEFSEEMIHQVIHTIEFCLNCISHTASYLRLWALSLAHNQLSQVLWSMTISLSFGPTGIFGAIMVFFMFAVWFILTVLVLVLMEGTSAMLHALRLHWVEAMSKHFMGDGIPFEPFSFKTLLEAESAESQ